MGMKTVADRNGGGPSADSDLIEQDDTPLNDDGIEVNFVDDEGDPPIQARRGQNEDPDFFEGETDDDDDDLAGVSQKVRDRIMRERRLRLDDANRHAQELERAEATVLTTTLEKASAQRDAIKVGLDGLDVRLTTLREGLKQARTEGDVSAETDIEAGIRQIENLRREIEAQAQRIPSDEQIKSTFAQYQAQERPKRAARSGGSEDGRPLNALAGQWRDRNAWMDDPSKAEELRSLVAISTQLGKEGLAPDSQEHFVELTRRMAKSYPNLGVRDLSGRQMGPSRSQPQDSRRSSPPVGGNRGKVPMSGVTRSKDGKPQVALDQSDRRMMRQLGIDPENKKHAVYFAKEKLTRLTREAQRNR